MARLQRRRKLLLLLLLAAAIALAITYGTCGRGWGLGGLGKGDGDGTSTGKGLVDTTDAAPARCQILVASEGITVDGTKTTQYEAIAACKSRGGADVVVTGDARQGDWEDLKSAFDAAGIEIFKREPRGQGSAPAPSPSPSPPSPAPGSASAPVDAGS